MDPVLKIVDARAGGDVSRVIIDGAPALEGRTVAEQCADFARRFDHLRLKLISAPHGDLHMCPVLLLPPRSKASDFGVIIMESMGYPPISGSNLFCATAVALEQGFAAIREPQTELRVETPAGVVPITAFCSKGHCRRVEFENVPVRVKRTLAVDVDSGKAPLPVALVQAGVDYAVADAGRLGVSLDGKCHPILIKYGVQVVAAAGTDFALFHEAIRIEGENAHCTVAVFQKPGVICRSPTGTGTSALLALVHARGLIGTTTSLTTRSPDSGVFVGRITAVEERHGVPVLRTVVAGEVETGPAIWIH